MLLCACTLENQRWHGGCTWRNKCVGPHTPQSLSPEKTAVLAQKLGGEGTANLVGWRLWWAPVAGLGLSIP